MQNATNVPPEALSSEMRELYRSLNEESDLAVALIAANFLDQALRTLLERSFIARSNTVNCLLDPGNGPIGTFKNRADLAYCLGLINKYLHNDLIAIGEIRNIFAHQRSRCNFDSSSITEKCKKLKYLKALSEDNIARLGKDAGIPLPLPGSTPRARFTITIATISMQLVIIAMQCTPPGRSVAFIKNLKSGSPKGKP